LDRKIVTGRIRPQRSSGQQILLDSFIIDTLGKVTDFRSPFTNLLPSSVDEKSMATTTVVIYAMLIGFIALHDTTRLGKTIKFIVVGARALGANDVTLLFLAV
jgi:hypothetical protein